MSGAQLIQSRRSSEPAELMTEITRLALRSECKATFRSSVMLAIGGMVSFSRAAWVEAPPFGELRTEVPGVRSMRPHAVGASPQGVLRLELRRFGMLRASLVLERDDRQFVAEEVQALAELLPTLVLADEVTGVASATPVRALTPRESEIVEYVGLGYTNAQIALATGRSVSAVRNLLVRVFDKTGVRTRTQLVTGPLAMNGLTRRERDIVEHLRRGLTNREIGRALGISTNTVRNTLARLFDKVGVSTRSELMGALVTENGDSSGTSRW